jgi:hypothetical protein
MNEPDGSQEGIAEQANSTVSVPSAQSSRRFSRHSTARNKWASPASANHDHKSNQCSTTPVVLLTAPDPRLREE